LIISDVPAGQEWNVASGPTLEPPRESPDPRDVIDKYGLRNRLPGPILRELESQTATRTAASRNTRDYFVLLDNQTALDAAAQAAREQGFITEISPEISDQSIETGSELLIDKLEQMRHVHRGSGKTICLISGGEFACPVRGNGIGGRNLETALRLAGSPRFDTANSVALCAGTDGIDGNSPAAGAIVDHTTVSRARAIGVEPRDFLERSDSYSFFTALGDVVSTGRTGTNVRDVRIILSK
jgi:hydroxypyruvate reductase